MKIFKLERTQYNMSKARGISSHAIDDAIDDASGAHSQGVNKLSLVEVVKQMS